MDLEADLKLMEIEIVATDQTDTKTEIYIWKRTLPFSPLPFSLNLTCKQVSSKIYPRF